MTRALLLIDGEHYPPVIEGALPVLAGRGLEPVAALFLGGDEKTAGPPMLPFPVTTGDPFTTLPALVAEHRVELVLDLSDEPVLDHRARFTLAGLALAAGVSYAGGGFRFDPPPMPRLSHRPAVSVIGTGKRTGKTAVAIELARHWRAGGLRPCIVTMGRGGPPEPVILRAADLPPPETVLEELAARGYHATSDYVEDAVLAGVDTVGTRRLGAGPAGVTVVDDFAAGVRAAEHLDPDVVVYEGSGTAVPPARADATVLVATSGLDPEFLVGYLGPFRLALADVLVVVGKDTRLGRQARRVAPGLPVVGAELIPEPTVAVAGRRVVVVTTARPAAVPAIGAALLQEGATAVEVVTTLGSRHRLATDLGGISGADLILTEIKAAAADMVVPAARRAGAEVGFLHNRVTFEGGVDSLAGLLLAPGLLRPSPRTPTSPAPDEAARAPAAGSAAARGR